jgi:hypothetical protein
MDGLFKKERVYRAIEEFGARNSYELLKDTGLDAASIKYALKDLCGTERLECNDGYYSIPRANQIDLFRMVAL